MDLVVKSGKIFRENGRGEIMNVSKKFGIDEKGHIGDRIIQLRKARELAYEKFLLAEAYKNARFEDYRMLADAEQQERCKEKK